MLAIRYNESFFIGDTHPNHLNYHTYKHLSNHSRKVFKSLRKSWSYSCLNLAADTTRVSLAYKKLHQLPSRVTRYGFYRNTQILDLTHNEIRNLSFLSRFKKLNSLILDHNVALEVRTLPYMPNLQLLWLNNCNIMNLSMWVMKIKESCPNLRYLSLMENPGSMWGDLVYNRREYRGTVISFLPTLEYLDDGEVTKYERINALLNVDTYHLMSENIDTTSEMNLKLTEEDNNDDEEYIAFALPTSFPG